MPLKVSTDRGTTDGADTIPLGLFAGLGVLVAVLVLIALLIVYMFWLRRRGQR